MYIFRRKFNLLLVNLFSIALFCSFTMSVEAQSVKFKNLKSLNVGAKHEAMVKVMFTSSKEEYFYSTFRNTKVKKVNVAKIECKIRKSDSVCVEVTLNVDNAKDAKKLMKQASKEFGTPKNQVKTSLTTFDWVWDDKPNEYYIESKVWHNIDENNAYLKILLIKK